MPLGLDLARFARPDRAAARAQLGIPADAVVVLAMGRLVPIKRLERVIEAIAMVAPQFPDVRLAVVGDGEERVALEALADARGIP